MMDWDGLIADVLVALLVACSFYFHFYTLTVFMFVWFLFAALRKHGGN